MKWLVRAGVALLVLGALAIAGLAIALPRIAGSDAMRSRVEVAARETLGRELHYRDLDFGLLPPSLLVLDPVVAGAEEGDPPFAEADEVGLRIALLPLFVGSVVIDSLVVDTATLRLTRTAEGIALPGPPPAEGESPASGAPADATAPVDVGQPAGIALGVRSVVLRNTALVVEDRAVKPPVTWRVEDVALEATGSALREPIDIDGSLRLESGGDVALGGTATLAGALDLVIELRDVELAPARPYLEGAALTGRLGGTLRIRGPAADPESVTADLELADATLELDDVALRGPLSIDAEVRRALTQPDGSFEIDASDALVELQGSFRKPAGTPTTVSGRIVSDEAGAIGLEDVSVRIRNLKAEGRVETGASNRIELRAEPFDLEGWETLVPALEATPLSGVVAVPSLALTTAPLAAHGSIELRDVVARPPDQTPVTLNGAIDFDGSELHTRDFEVVAAEQTLRVEAALRNLFESPVYDVRVRTSEVETNALLAGYAEQPDKIYGPLGSDGRFSGPLAGDEPLLDSVTGKLSFDILKGKIVGVSLLEVVFQELGSLGGLAVDAGRVFGGSDLQRFYGEEFEAMRGRLRVVDGSVLADDLSLQYKDYGAELRGTIRLADLGLDLAGSLTLYEAVDAELAEQAGVKSHTPSRRTLPLAAVRGTVGAPEVQISSNQAAKFASAYAADLYIDKAKEEIEKELGPGTGEVIDQGLDVLDGLLGGGRR